MSNNSEPITVNPAGCTLETPAANDLRLKKTTRTINPPHLCDLHLSVNGAELPQLHVLIEAFSTCACSDQEPKQLLQFFSFCIYNNGFMS